MKTALKIISRFFIAVAILIAPFPLFFTGTLGPTVVCLVCFGWIVLVAELAQRWVEPTQHTNFEDRQKKDETQGARRQQQTGSGTGNLARPAPRPFRKRTWREVLRFKEGEKPTMQEVNSAWRQLAKSTHPDVGGSNARMVELNMALSEASRELKT